MVSFAFLLLSWDFDLLAGRDFVGELDLEELEELLLEDLILRWERRLRGLLSSLSIRLDAPSSRLRERDRFLCRDFFCDTFEEFCAVSSLLLETLLRGGLSLYLGGLSKTSSLPSSSVLTGRDLCCPLSLLCFPRYSVSKLFRRKFELEA